MTTSTDPVRTEHLATLLGRVTRDLAGLSTPNPDEDSPPGPWDPVIRASIRRMFLGDVRSLPLRRPFSDALWHLIASRRPEIFDLIHQGSEVVGPHPEPWSEGPHPDPWKRVIAAIAYEVASRAAMAQQVIDVTGEASRGTTSGVSRWVGRFADDFCGNDLRLRWPFPTPRPKWWKDRLESMDRILLGIEMHESARETNNPALAATIESSAEKLVQTGVNQR